MPKRDIFRLAYNVTMLAGREDTAEVMLYGEIVQDGPEWWKWSKEDKSAADFDKAIKDVRKAGAAKLLLRINSPGGVCTEAVAMRTILAAAGFEETTVRIEGLCASAATFLATLPGAHVQIGEGAEYMIHNPLCGCWGNAADLESCAARLRNIEETSRGFYAARTGQSDEQVKSWMDAETWFTAEQAVEYGFADEILKAEEENETPAAACVTGRAMDAMRGLYRAVPEQIAVREETDPAEGEKEPVSNGASAVVRASPHAGPLARNGEPTENIKNEEDNTQMDIETMTAEQLQAGNPALFEQVRQSAVAAERERLADIDALTLPGYEAMAQAAKDNGTSALDFQRQIVQAQKEKGSAYLQQRGEELGPAQEVAGGAPAGGRTEEQEIDDNAKAVAEYAKQYAGSVDGSMY